MAETKVTPTNRIEPIRCPKCGQMAYVIRRTIDAFRRDGTELWTFQCVNGHNTEVSGRR